jgi:hypothetical protein
MKRSFCLFCMNVKYKATQTLKVSACWGEGIFGPQKLNNKRLDNMSRNIWAVKLRMVRWPGHVAHREVTSLESNMHGITVLKLISGTRMLSFGLQWVGSVKCPVMDLRICWWISMHYKNVQFLEDYFLSSCGATHSARSLPTFQTNVLSPSWS